MEDSGGSRNCSGKTVEDQGKALCLTALSSVPAGVVPVEVGVADHVDVGAAQPGLRHRRAV